MHVCGNPWHDVPMLVLLLAHQPDLFLPMARNVWSRLSHSVRSP